MFLVHRPTGRRLSFGEVAAAAVLPDPLPTVSVADLKPPADWRYMGKDVPRVDVPGKVRGEAGFGIDVQPEGLLFGAVARSPVQGEAPLHVDDATAREMRGVIAIVPLSYGVGVIATSTWTAWRARDALQITWSSRSPARTYDSTRTLDAYAAIAARTDGGAKIVAQRGDVRTALNGAARVIETTYLSEHVHQATMEPPSATALVQDDRARVWGSFQAQTVVQNAAADALGISAANVAVETLWLGGGFGRKYESDFALDAVLLAQAVKGRPVKVTWTREDDVRHGKYRPSQAQHIRIGLDGHGRIIAWRHRLVSPSILARYSPERFAKGGGLDAAVTEGIAPNYAIPALLAEWRPMTGVVDIGFYRAIGPGYTKFAIECTMDEVAASIGIDPLKLRLDLLADAPRAQNVLRVAARMADWGRHRSDTALGLAYSDAFGSHCAQVAEISLDRGTGEIRVRNIWCAFDCGLSIQPTNIKAQIMGGALHGLSQAIHEQISFTAGAVQEIQFQRLPDPAVQRGAGDRDCAGRLGDRCPWRRRRSRTSTNRPRDRQRCGRADGRTSAPLPLPRRSRQRRLEGRLMKLTENQRRVWRRVAAWGMGGLFIVAVIIGVFATWRLLDRDPEPTAPDQRATPALIARGEYLARAADCAACHSPPGRAPFSGGLAFRLPFGVIYSTNITADRDTGIGAWSDDDVVRALHLGVARGGGHLYPAFPYTSYTGLTRDDAVAIKAYLFSLPPVHASARPNALIFPFNQRWAMAFWNLVFLDAHRFRADAKLSEQQNRGAYLATALGHCGECHTPRNLGFAMEDNAQFAGTLVNGWRAYNITPDPISGVGRWSDQQLFDYLHAGHADGRGSAAGPMGEAVGYSLQFLSPGDLNALVAYLRTVKPAAGGGARTSSVREDALPESALGRQIFEGSCTGCHLMDGEGRQTPYAALAGSAAVQDSKGVNITQVLLNGADARSVHPLVAMPAFAGGMTDDEIAALANFTIAHFGGRAGQVSAREVRHARSS